MIKAVTFDLWNTLLYDCHYGDSRIDLLTQILGNKGFSKDKLIVEAAYSSAIDCFDEAWRKERRHIPASKLTEFILNRLGVRLPVESKNTLATGFEEAIFDDPPPLMNGAKILLKSLSGRYKIGLVSNSGVTPGKNLRKVLNDHKVLQYFTCAVFSDEVGYHKPHPMIFERALKELDVKASDTIHVGDLPESDIVGAKEMGMKTAWFNKTEKKWQDLKMGFSTDYEIRTLLELVDILGKQV